MIASPSIKVTTATGRFLGVDSYAEVTVRVPQDTTDADLRALAEHMKEAVEAMLSEEG